MPITDPVTGAVSADDGRTPPQYRLSARLEIRTLARSTRHLLTALEEFDHFGVRFVSVQDQVDTDTPMGRAMFTIIGAMEIKSSLISERVTAGMRAAEARGKHLGRPAIPKRVVSEIEAFATSTDLSVRQIQAKIGGQASRGIVGEITKRARASSSPIL